MPDASLAGFEALLERSRSEAMGSGRALTAVLAEAAGGSRGEALAWLADRFALSPVDLSQATGMTPRFDRVSFTECQQRGLLVADDDAGRRWLLLADPFDAGAEDWALRRLGGRRPGLGLMDADDLATCLARIEQRLRAMDGFTADGALPVDDDDVTVITLASIDDDESDVVRLVNSTIYDALKAQASDIHLESDAGGMYVKYRIDGVLVPITQMPGPENAEQAISRIKVMADLDIGERRVPQDGRFKVRVNGRDIDFRVSVMPNIFGEDAVLRLLDRQALTEDATRLTLDNLGLEAGVMAAIRWLAQRPHGMLLMTGPTGSGKTTTLYAVISEINGGQDKIVTIEDPVEYRLPRLLQIPVNERKGLTFAKGLRSILRHDPDKIMVGEIRDSETAQIAVQASLTGHLVFTTVHANNVFDVLGRFLHMGVDPYSFAASLNGIVAQRLLRLNCAHCSEPCQPDDDLVKAAGLAGTAGWAFRRGLGCGHCRGSGYRGRRAVAEVLTLDDAMRELIAARAPVSELRARAAAAGLVPLRTAALELVRTGQTTLEEVVRVAG